jgi:dTDP-4-amino-4,6-dideoxygalactose transaminase
MHKIGEAEIRAVRKVIAGKQFMRYRGGEGGYTEKFEQALCEKMKVKHALTVNSGTAALTCAAVGLGLGPGDEFIVPAYTWIATALGPLAAGAVPVMADVDESLTLDPADVERKITPYTKAIVPVHMGNLVCNMDAIMALAAKHNLKVIEDACQAVGAVYKGRRVATIGHAGAFSFNMFKNITCAEGGAVLSDDDETFYRATIYHDVGSFSRAANAGINVPFFAGVNFRVSEIQGAMMGEQLKRLDGFIDGLRKRRALVAEIVSKSARYRVSPHHDPANALALTLLFETVDAAKAFAAQHKLGRPIDSGLHVYTNWEPLMKQRTHHPKLNPFAWAHRKIEYSHDMCARSLDIMARTCSVGFAYNAPLAKLRDWAKTLV